MSFKIHQQQNPNTPEDFAALQQAMQREGFDTQKVFVDKELTLPETLSFFDLNQDGKIYFSEIASVRNEISYSRFETLKTILKKYDFDLYRQAYSDPEETKPLARILEDDDDYIVRWLGNCIAMLDHYVSQQVSPQRMAEVLRKRPQLLESVIDHLFFWEAFPEIENLSPPFKQIFLPVIQQALTEDRIFDLLGKFHSWQQVEDLSKLLTPAQLMELIRKHPEKIGPGLSKNISGLLLYDNRQPITSFAFRRMMWPAIVALADHRGVKLPPQMRESYNAFILSFNALTLHPERFKTFESLEALARGGKLLSHDPLDKRPLVLVIGAASDYEENGRMILSTFDLPEEAPGSFESYLQDGRFWVTYRETEFDTFYDLFWIISENKKYPIYTTLVMGHSDETLLELGEGYYFTPAERRNEHKFLSVEDFYNKPEFKNLAWFLDPNGFWIYDSCKAGKGGARKLNFVNATARVLPSGMTVMGNGQNSAIKRIHIREDLSPEVEWSNQESYEEKGKVEVPSY